MSLSLSLSREGIDDSSVGKRKEGKRLCRRFKANTREVCREIDEHLRERE
jgi:hypothetical protein